MANKYKKFSTTRARDRAVILAWIAMGYEVEAKNRTKRNSPWQWVSSQSVVEAFNTPRGAVDHYVRIRLG